MAWRMERRQSHDKGRGTSLLSYGWSSRCELLLAPGIDVSHSLFFNRTDAPGAHGAPVGFLDTFDVAINGALRAAPAAASPAFLLPNLNDDATATLHAQAVAVLNHDRRFGWRCHGRWRRTGGGAVGIGDYRGTDSEVEQKSARTEGVGG
ncbi:hypothetical protein OsI_25796 [Oryza sativa Indica Group]|uniref:Uncharacterized protein n=1 Tax=Oryza sativa subsp. indica TaxID=39946 RepID=B8B5R7_ORYSI|nr:hypothetical protein OsI_25796 [Oryza sativa Indica Group]